MQKFPLEAQANGLISHVSASGALFAWVDVSSAGGQYRLCWCSSFTKCSTAEDYQTDLGALHLVGPFGHTSAGHRTFTCFTGQVCDASGVSGLYLSENDAYAVHDTCGEQLVPRFPEYGRSVSTGRNGATISWGSVAISSAGGALAEAGPRSSHFTQLLHHVLKLFPLVQTKTRTDYASFLCLRPFRSEMPEHMFNSSLVAKDSTVFAGVVLLTVGL